MRKIFLSIILSFLCHISLFSQDDKEKWVQENYTKSECQITMRDGIRLFTIIYSPKDTSANHPILLNRTPYSVAPYGGTEMRSDLWNNLFPYTQNQYIIVFQDVRGKFMSEGRFENIRPYIPYKKESEIDETSDSYDTADWLVKNVSHNNGRIGVYGVSYP